MLTRSLTIFVITSTLLLVSADLPERDLLAQAQAALRQEQYQEAIDLLSNAEPRATDPGHVAYNKAVALYRLAQKSKDPTEKERLVLLAEDHFSRCDNDPPERRAQAALGWANCLVQRSNPNAVDLEREIERMELAMQLYRRANGLTRRDDVKRRAQTNVNVAKKQWLVLMEELRKKPPENRDPDDPDNGSSAGQDDPGNNPDRADGSDPGSQAQQPNGQGNGGKGDRQGEQRQSKKDTSVGGSSANPQKPNEQTPDVSASKAREKLHDAVQKILDERRAARTRSAAAPSSTLKDW